MQLSLYNNDDTRHSPRNEREAVLYYLSKMDTGMLELVLSDNRTYQDAGKEVFLEKLNKSLSEFRENGDSTLRIVKGECHNDQCHKGCAGYAFIGNCSGFHLDLIVEEANHEILDMYYCSDFSAYTEPLDENKKISIHIRRDEEADFKPSVWFLMTAYRCSNACDEIIRKDLPLPVVDMQKAEQWLEKHKELYDTMDPIFTPAAFSRFQILYSAIKGLVPQLNLKEEAERGLKFYQNRVKRSRNEKMLLCWLVEFEQLGDDLMDLHYFYFNVDGEPTKEYVKINRTEEVYLCAGDFAAQLKFLHIYNKYYWDMLEKYTTITEEMWTTLEDGTEAAEKRVSLKYHLQQRGLI